MAGQSLRMPWTMSSAVAARRAMVPHLRMLGVDAIVVDDSEIVLAELVANAVRHARPMEDGTIHVSWSVTAGVVEIEVTDGGGPTTPHTAPCSAWSAGGRGLRIVGSLANEWGVLGDRVASTVWASMGGPSRRRSL